MALADYFQRSALAVAQIAQGFDEQRLTELLDSTAVSVTVGAPTREAQMCADLTVRLLSRLYPQISIDASDATHKAELTDLALAINPNLTHCSRPPAAGIVIGMAKRSPSLPTFAGSEGWTATVGGASPLVAGDSDNPFGAGAAACLAAAALFRRVVLGQQGPAEAVAFSTWSGAPDAAPGPPLEGDCGRSALAGAGAIGNAIAWALSRTAIDGEIHLVDHETIELSNLQRYVLASRADENRIKVELLASQFSGSLRGVPAQQSWQDFVADNGYDWERVLVGLDSARDRRAVQASLPREIVNGWTQPADLGVSIHPKLNAGACVACLYHPAGTVPNEDELVASALGLDHAVFGLEIRQLLDAHAFPSARLLDEVQARLGAGPERIAAFRHRPLRDLYVEGVCGGALVPLDKLGVPDQRLHVPLAHQSALAGVLVAARFAGLVSGQVPEQTMVTRLNVLTEVSQQPTQPAAKRVEPVCICQDPVYIERYRQKWDTA